MTFKKGETANPGGRPKVKQWRDALERAVIKATNGKIDYKRLDQLAEALIQRGLDGDVHAIKEIGDRIDGRVVQAIQGDLTLNVSLAQKIAAARKRE